MPPRLIITSGTRQRGRRGADLSLSDRRTRYKFSHLIPRKGDDDYAASDAEQAGQLARAGRGARIGTRAGRITRVIRLVRLIRIGRLWRQANDIQNKKSEDDEFSKLLIRQRAIQRE